MSGLKSAPRQYVIAAVSHPHEANHDESDQKPKIPMPRKSVKKLSDREYVRLHVEDLGITLFGELKRRRDGRVVFIGIADGLTKDNPRALSRKLELSGFSNRSGRIWIKDLIFRETAIHSDISRPSTVKIFARALYSGSFDPRSTLVSCVTAKLPTSQWLSDRRLKKHDYNHSSKEHVIIASGPIEPIVLYADNEVVIEINHFASVGEHINHEERLSVNSIQSGTSERADFFLDAICLLISVLTQARCWPKTREYWRYKSNKHERARRRTWVEKQDQTDFMDWLRLPGQIIETIMKMFPQWIVSLKNPETATLIRYFVSAANKKGYPEDRFLGFCQCFEGLNQLRVADVNPFPECSVEMLTRLAERAKELGTNSAFRRKLKRAFDYSISPTLEDRLRGVFDKPPYCIQDKLNKNPKLFAEIANRRNQISHGSTDAAINTQFDYDQLLREMSVVRALCLAEVLLLGGMALSEISEIVCLDIWMTRRGVR